MANIPEHIHAFPRVNPNVVLPKAVAAWDENSKTLYIGDGITKGGVPFKSSPECLKISSCLNNQISVPLDYIPFMIKLNNNKFYTVRGEDLSIDNNNFIVDISNALAKNDMKKFEADWYIYFGGKTEF